MDCPLAWMWSTHRDVVGATVDPWVTSDRLAQALGYPTAGFAERQHAYVSGDPSANVASTSFPVAAEPSRAAMVGLGEIAAACAAALRVSLGAMRRHGQLRGLFAALARDQGWGDTRLLATLCGCSPLTIRRIRDGVDARALAAARLCLGDARLRSAITSEDVAAWAEAPEGVNAKRSDPRTEGAHSSEMNAFGSIRR